MAAMDPAYLAVASKLRVIGTTGIAENNMILTPLGLRSAVSILPGDYVTCADGDSVQINGATFIMEVSDQPRMVHIELDSGGSLIVGSGTVVDGKPAFTVKPGDVLGRSTVLRTTTRVGEGRCVEFNQPVIIAGVVVQSSFFDLAADLKAIADFFKTYPADPGIN